MTVNSWPLATLPTMSALTTPMPMIAAHVPDATEGDAELPPPVPHQAEETAPQFDPPDGRWRQRGSHDGAGPPAVMGEAFMPTATASSPSSIVPTAWPFVLDMVT